MTANQTSGATVGRFQTPPTLRRLITELAKIGAALPLEFPEDVGSVDRFTLREMAEVLESDLPDSEALDGAQALALEGYEHSFRPGFTEERPESYLLAACFRLFAAEGYGL